MTKVVVILGAGASHGIVSSTQAITDKLLDYPIPQNDDPLSPQYNTNPQQYFRILQECLGCEATFEHFLDEALKRAKDTKLPDHSRHITAVLQGSLLAALTIHEDMEKARKKQELESSPSVLLLNRLSISTPLTVGTLNWDSLPVHCSPRWYDGYSHDETSESKFDHNFQEKCEESHYRLLWLHGSIHFNRPASEELMENPRDFAFRWFKDANDALHRWNQGLSRGPTGDLTPRFPVITAGNKPNQLFTRPFFDYWTTLFKHLLETKALVVIGYSGGDDHLNGLLTEASRYNDRLSLVVWINKENDLNTHVEQKLCSTLAKVFQEPAYLYFNLCSHHGQRFDLESPEGFQRFAHIPTVNHRTTWVYLNGVDHLCQCEDDLRKLETLLENV